MVRLNKPFVITAIFVVALLLRVIFVFEWFRTPYGAVPLLDAASYDQWAREIAAGQFLRAAAFYQSPLYPYLLAVLYKIVGPDFTVVAYLQAIVGAATCAWIALIAFESSNELAALVAGLLASFYRPMIFFTAPLMKETLSLFLLAGTVYFMLQSFKTKRGFWLGGFFLGLTALTRGNVLILAPMYVGFFIWHHRSTFATPVAVFCLGLGLAVLPATLHNAIVSHDFVLLNYTGGYNFYIGNSTTATGSNAYPDGISSDPAQEERDVTRIAETGAGRKLKPSEISSYWSAKGLSFVVENPIASLTLLINKIILLTNNFEQPDNYDIAFIASEMPTILQIPLVGFGLLFVLAAIGICLNPTRLNRIQIILGFAYAVSIVGFYVTDRYRLPIVIFLFPLAGSAIAGIRELRGRRLLICGAITIIAAGITFFPITGHPAQSNAFNWGVLAGLESEQGHDREAIADYAKSLAISEMGSDADAAIKVSTSFERIGELPAAARILTQFMISHPTDSLVPYNLGRLRLSQSNPRAALPLFEKAQALAPWKPLPYLGLAASQFSLGNLVEAKLAVDRGLAVSPQSPELRMLSNQIQARDQSASRIRTSR